MLCQIWGFRPSCGAYLFDYNVRCGCPALLGDFRLLPHFGGDVLPFLRGAFPWPVLLVGPGVRHFPAQFPPF